MEETTEICCSQSPGNWQNPPALVREAGVGVAVASPDSNSMAPLSFDIVLQFAAAQRQRMFSSELVQRLGVFPARPWVGGEPLAAGAYYTSRPTRVELMFAFTTAACSGTRSSEFAMAKTR
jgi:hypothetical protein